MYFLIETLVILAGAFNVTSSHTLLRLSYAHGYLGKKECLLSILIGEKIYDKMTIMTLNNLSEIIDKGTIVNLEKERTIFVFTA